MNTKSNTYQFPYGVSKHGKAIPKTFRLYYSFVTMSFEAKSQHRFIGSKSDFKKSFKHLA
jgi:hypothetical protein